MNDSDRLKQMFEQQTSFMKLLKLKRGFPEFPLDLNLKENQVFCKHIVYEIMGELFEAVQELRNSKSHRVTDVKEFNRDKLVEEVVDSLHYFHELCILMDITPNELFHAYMKKGDVNVKRINNNY